MHALNIVMSGLMATSIISAIFFGQHFLRLSYKMRLAIVAGYAIAFGGWIVLAHLV